jgi:hypothetical protein
VNRNRTSKWASLGRRIAKLKDGESIVLECEGDPNEEAHKIRDELDGVATCMLVRRTVEVFGGRIVITRVGTWPTPGGWYIAYHVENGVSSWI